MCRTVHAVLSTAICGVQMLVRVFMTIILMIENVIRMILQTLYNFISFMLQMLSLIPICIVFLLTARLKCFMCGGGGPCPVNRGGACDCIMSALAIAILFFIFRATGVLDKMFYSIGYAKALPAAPARFVPTPGDITECSRNETDYDYGSTTIEMFDDMTYEVSTEDGGAALAKRPDDNAESDVENDRENDESRKGIMEKVGPENGGTENGDINYDSVKSVPETDRILRKGTYHKITRTRKRNFFEQLLTTDIIYNPNG